MNQATAPRSRFNSLQTILGIAIASLGLMVMAGWVLQVRAMVEIRPGLVAMVFNTALCFALTGSALAASGLCRRPTWKFQMAVGGAIFLLCLGVLIEQVLDKSLGLDWAFLHTWLRDGNTRPGRLAPNTAIGFMLIGATLILSNNVSNKWRASAVQILTLSVMAVGLTGLIGYTLAPDLLYGWARSARMAIHTASAMIVTAIALWLSWYPSEWYQSRRFFHEDEKISFIAAAILVVVSITSGLTGFVFQQQILENALRENLRAALKSRVILFQTVVQQGVINARNTHKMFDNTALGPAVFSRAALPDATQFARAELSKGYRGVALYAANGKPLLLAGNLTRSAEISADLHAAIPTQLLWDGDLFLRTEQPLLRAGVTVAILVTEAPLSTLRRELFDLSGVGRSGEVALCKLDGENMFCFPEGPLPKATKIKRRSGSGQPLPMSYALDGRTGIIASVDYRNKNVIAAYGPLAPGLGLVVKEDTAELYHAVRDQLKAVFPALLILAGVGTLLLRFQLKPLAARLIASERLAKEQELEIKAVVSSVGEGIIIIDQDGIVESFNTAASHIFGYAAEEVMGKPMRILMPPEMRGPHEQGMRRYLAGGAPHVIGRQGVELPGLRKDGKTFPLELTVNEIHLEHRRLFVGIVRDITERKQTEEKLVFLAQYDALTGLPNRSLFMDRLESAARRAARNRTGLGLMFLDLDGFKKVNDTFGHHSGDELLKQFAARLTAVVRKTDTVSRLAGDEFTILLEGLAAPETDTKAIAEKIIAAMQPPFLLGTDAVQVSTSIGLATHSAGDFDLEALLRRADHAMYSAKNSGKNRWCMGDEKESPA